MRFARLPVTLLCAATLAACAIAAQDRQADGGNVQSTAAATGTSAVERGRLLVEANCLTCHSREVDEPSPHPSAPSFARIFVHYPPDYIAESFAEGVFVGHSDMPPFQFEPAEINDLVAYLKQLPTGE